MKHGFNATQSILNTSLHEAISTIDNVDHRETSIAMHVILAAWTVGPNTERLCRETGHNVNQVQPMVERLRCAKLWGDGFVDDREWSSADDKQRMWVLFLQAHVARGLLFRKVIENVACYVAEDGEEVASVVISGACRRG